MERLQPGALRAAVPGDAVYLRDLTARHLADLAASYPPEKLVKLSCLYELLGLPDCAAEILTRFAERLGSLGDPEPLLDALTPPLLGEQLGYRQYLATFEASPERFLRTPRVEWEASQEAARIEALAEAKARARYDAAYGEWLAGEAERRQRWFQEVMAARGSLFRRVARRLKRLCTRTFALLPR